MPDKLKPKATLSDQLNMLGQLAYTLEQSPHGIRDTIAQHFNLNSEQFRAFMSAYRKAGDDPLEV
jgi:hypothetical protein